jgi:hypothetical protein
MKLHHHVLTAAVCCILAAGVCRAALPWTAGFEESEGYTLGTIIGQQGWQEYPLADTTATGMVVDTMNGGATIPEEDQCLWAGAGSGGASALVVPVDITGPDYSQNYCAFSCKAYPDADYCEWNLMEIAGGVTNRVSRLLSFLGNLWFGADLNNDGNNDWVLAGQPGAEHLQWHDWKIVIDMVKKKIVRIEADTNIWLFDNVWFYKNDGVGADTVNALRLYNNGAGGSSGRAENYWDAFLIDTEALPPQPPTIDVIPGTINLGNENTNATYDVYNNGTGSFTYTAAILDSAPGLTLNKSGGTVTQSDTLSALVDRTGLGDGVYRARIEFDAGDAGSATSIVVYSVGTYYYETGFDSPWYHEGDMENQDGWHKANTDEDMIVITNAYDSDDSCAFIEHTYFYGGYDQFFSIPDGKVVEMGVRIYVPDIDSFDQFLLVYPGLSDQVFTISDGQVVLNFPQNTLPHYPEPVDVDTWFDFSFKIDFSQSLLLEVTMNDSVAKYTNVLIRDINTTTLQKVRLIAPRNGEGPAGVGLDGLYVKEIPPEGPAQLAAQSYVHFKEGVTEGTISLNNTGDGYYDYTIVPLHSNEVWMTVGPLSGRVSNSVDLTVTVDRTGQASGYYYNQFAVDAGEAGSATVLVAMSVGTVFYDSGFDAPWFVPGNLNNQDGWLRTDPGGKMIITNVAGSESSCAYIYYTGFYDGYLHNFDMPGNRILKVAMTLNIPADKAFDLLLLVMPGMPDSQFTLDNDMVVLDWPQQPGMPLPPPVPADEWFDYSFVLDFETKELQEITMGDQTVVYTNEIIATAGTGISWLRFTCLSTNGTDAAGVAVDRFTVEEIPEPFTATGIAAALAILFCALRRTP